MNFLVRILISAIVAFGLSYILPGIHIDKFTTALKVALVLALLDTFLKPLLVILTFPITLLTLGLFLFIINGLIILLAHKFVPGFNVDSIWWAILFSLLLSIITSVVHKKD